METINTSLFQVLPELFSEPTFILFGMAITIAGVVIGMKCDTRTLLGKLLSISSFLMLVVGSLSFLGMYLGIIIVITIVAIFFVLPRVIQQEKAIWKAKHSISKFHI